MLTLSLQASNQMTDFYWAVYYNGVDLCGNGTIAVVSGKEYNKLLPLWLNACLQK